MFIQIQQTPNPNSLKFLPGVEILIPEGVEKSITKSTYKKNSNFLLANVLFEIDGIESLYFGKDFISVTKKEEIEWYNIKTLILSAMMDSLMAGNYKDLNSTEINDKTNVEENLRNKINNINDPIQKRIIEQIIEVIETNVRPAVAEDGGDIEFDSFEDGIVYLRMHGACRGCPSSSMTLKNGIENMLKHYIPEVQEVRAIEE